MLVNTSLKERISMLKIEKSSEMVGFAAAAMVAKQLIKKPDSVIALPTGATPISMYETIVKFVKYGIISIEKAQLFNLDEYVGLTREDPMSFAYYMEKHLLSRIERVQHNIPATDTKDPEREASDYEEKIEKAGGFDLCLLGIGIDGHIGFNEPGTPFSSITHVAHLHPSTIERNSKEFGRGRIVPDIAITVGIKTIMKSRHIVLMATGVEKSSILKESLFGEITSDVPASVLQLHPNLTILVDKECAAKVISNASEFHRMNL